MAVETLCAQINHEALSAPGGGASLPPCVVSGDSFDMRPAPHMMSDGSRSEPIEGHMASNRSIAFKLTRTVRGVSRR